MICAALGAVAVGATVALAGLLHQDAPAETAEVAELLGGPPGYALPQEDPSATTTSTSTSPTTTVTSTTKAPAKPAPKPGGSGGSGRPGGMPSPVNTGPVPGTQFTVVNGDQTFSQSGQVI